MKNSFVILFIFFTTVKIGFAEKTNLVYRKLCEINKEWLNHADAFQMSDEAYVPKSDVSLIQLHLQLVEQSLRNAGTKHLEQSQIENRNRCLDILNTYWKDGIFPINTFHKERTPYFIDYFGTACAVGQLVIKTGHENFAKQIQLENNYAYILDLENSYQLLNDWADIHGFTLDELRWIQPTYSSSCWDENGSVTNPTCKGYCDGSIDLEIPTGGTPPYYVSGPPCSSLCAGTYTYLITDADSNEYIQVYTLVDPEPIIPTIDLINNVSSYTACDASLSVTHTGGVAPFTYFWLDCNGGLIDNSQDVDSLCAGEYKIIINDVIGCSGVSDCVSIGTFASLNENKISFNYHLYPNPANDFLKIELSNTIGSSIIYLTDLTGRTVLNTEIENDFVINFHDFEKK